jgi:hypothetical protein
MNSLPSAPFKSGEIQPSEWSPVLHEHLDYKYSIIRTNIEFGLEKDDPVGETITGLRKSIKLYDELEKSYSIPHAGFRPIVGEINSGEIGAYILTDKIEGYGYRPPEGQEKSEFLETLRLRPEHTTAGTKLLQNLSDYWTDKVQNEHEMLTDIYSIDQYIYDQATNKFVLVDMDPFFVDNSQIKDASEVQAMKIYTTAKLQTLAASTLDLHELELWQRAMGPEFSN